MPIIAEFKVMLFGQKGPLTKNSIDWNLQIPVCNKFESEAKQKNHIK